jgi:hypothetical protein
MRHPIDALILLVLFVLLAIFVHAQTSFGFQGTPTSGPDFAGPGLGLPLLR